MRFSTTMKFCIIMFQSWVPFSLFLPILIVKRGWGYCQFWLCPEMDFYSKKTSDNYTNQHEEYQIKQRQDKVQKLEIDDNQKCLWHYPSPIGRKILALPSENNKHNDEIVLIGPHDDANLFVIV